MKARGFILYPGKLTQVETFRVGCIGAIGPAEMKEAVAAVAGAMKELGIAGARRRSQPEPDLAQDDNSSMTTPPPSTPR